MANFIEGSNKKHNENIKEKIEKAFQEELISWEKKYSKISDTNKIEAAKDLSEQLHNWSGTLRISSAKSYFKEHIEGVVANLEKELEVDPNIKTDLLSVAYLHDLIEDISEIFSENTGDELKEFLKEKFGEKIFDIVNSLSEDKEKRKQLEEEMKNGKLTKLELKEEMLENSLSKISALKEKKDNSYKIAALVRISDIINNLSDIDIVSEDLKERNLKKAKTIYNFFEKDNFNLLERLADIIKKNTNPQD